MKRPTIIDPKLRLLRHAVTVAGYSHGIGGRPKSDGWKPAPITLPRLKFLEGDVDERTSSD